MNTTLELHWYNFKTKEWEYGAEELTDEKALTYIPQDEVCQNYFKVLRQTGENVTDALIRVLSALTKGAK